jgi:uncharacterized protein YifE (UPF0438 family)
MYLPNTSYPPAERGMLEIHRIVNDAQVRQRHAAAMQNLDVGAKTGKSPEERSSGGGSAASGRVMPK